MLALHLLQNCMVYINTLMIQQVLARPHWAERLTATDLRALTPLIWEHVNPYGRFELDLAPGDMNVGFTPYCRECFRERDVDPSTVPLPPDVPVPEIGKRMKCSACRSTVARSCTREGLMRSE